MKNLSLLIVIAAMLFISLHAQEMFEARVLTSEPPQEGFPTWSPDNRSIVYQFTDMRSSNTNNGLWKITLDNYKKEQIFSGLAEHAVWSPDGRFIVFDSDTGSNIKMMPADGGEAVYFLPDSIKINKGSLPCWSPDASQIAFKDSEYSLCLHNFNSGETNKIFRREGLMLLPCCWTVDGKYILAALMNRETRMSTLLKVSSDGVVVKEIKLPTEKFYRYVELSPDGKFLVYAAREGKYFGLYIMPADGGNSLPLTVSSTGHSESPKWSPDGKHIAFTSTRAGSFDIWIMDVDIEVIKNKLSEINR